MSKTALIIFFAVAFDEICAQDPCKSAKLISDAAFRGTTCFKKRSLLCDRGYFKAGWYFSKSAGHFTTMPEMCPERASCGTLTPIWLNGQHPKQADGVVQRTACVRGLGNNECCRDNITIEIMNCGNSFVYNLPETTVCDEAFCFGNESCPTDLTTVVPLSGLHSSDPCNSAVSLQNTKIRGLNCQSSAIDRPICDRPLQERWYKADIIGIPLDIPQTCVPFGSCGTIGSIWMNGTIPSFNEGVVSRKACVRGFLKNECCRKSINIKVRNCVTYNVYYLLPAETCDESYCFGMHPCLDENIITTTAKAPQSDRIRNTVLYVIIGAMMILLLVAIVVIYLVIRHKKKEHGGSKVDIKHDPVIMYETKRPIPFNPPAYSKH